MGHGGYGKSRAGAAERKKPAGQRRPKALTVDKKSKANTKPKAVSLKNQIRSVERMLRKVLLPFFLYFTRTHSFIYPPTTTITHYLGFYV